MARIQRILRKLVIHEISGVDKPSSKDCTVKIMKRDNTDATPETGIDAVTEIRKLQSNGDFDRFEKSDYLGLLKSLAEEIQADGESIEKAFTRGLETPAGYELFQIMKGRAPADSEQDDAQPTPGPARAKVEALARDRQRTSGRSFAQSFADIIDDPANRALRDAANREREIELAGTLDIFDAQRLAPAKPFPANARGK